ncbi:23S rRNA (pseudouridine(1915)-N(3))-methyltransferase RlmH [Sphingobacterium sp. UT-1RO-CII-1]|uniref:23S rRNA (pseudouridine(1915)-N(3))-methyltransferase RlmH n=1 Tax=Sphingobacterium sp. UT-1RO-CII-1 TaxID=2995225 RepID=UPI00227D2841|nr:23S rRNA (pseudouridine(1915)-N(3))-methyltransferase RlmH [Sphingobacterium sp. UT-1RO-CII-1]MCY4779533.1 23S rRNA (pseudouridine(1915)-N(3))-methyltransferase RlmH [Sphingobacterium sp. UT-1RO-CII-1]
MKIILVCIGKTDDKLMVDAIDNYAKRLKHYINFEIKIISDLKNNKNLTQEQQKLKEGELLLKQVLNTDTLILLDERGTAYSSVGFSEFIEQKMLQSTNRLVFVVGGPYGFAESVYKRAAGLLSLSKMTFSHQMIRLFIVEQVYRAFTIMRGEPYHHE